MKPIFALAPLAALTIAGCASMQPPPAPKAQVTGSVLYRERIMLPPTATVTVTLADTSLMDAPAKVIDTQVLTGGSPPWGPARRRCTRHSCCAAGAMMWCC